MKALPWTPVLLLAFLASAAPASADLGDILFKRKTTEGNEYPPAKFPHSVHRYQFTCYVCHDNIFLMKAGANAVSMDAISKGKYCGVCHNDTKDAPAFGSTFESCQRCHQP